MDQDYATLRQETTMPKLLVIEDDNETAAEIIAEFTDLGFDVAWAANGIDGLDKARSDRPDALIVDAPWPAAERPRCDALVTATRGLGLGVTGADCGIILFADEEAGVIGAHGDFHELILLKPMRKVSTNRNAGHAGRHRGETESLLLVFVLFAGFHAFFHMVNGGINGLDGRHTMPAFVVLGLVQVLLSLLQRVECGLHVRLVFVVRRPSGRGTRR